MADRCLPVLGIEVSAEGVGRHYGARSAGGLLDAWLVAPGDAADVPGVDVAVGAAADVRPGGDRRAGPRRPGRCAGRPVREPPRGHLACTRSRGCPSSPPATTSPRPSPAPRPWLADGDVVVVTSKVVSKVGGPAGAGRRRARTARPPGSGRSTGETVRVVARRGPLRIVETPQGWVVAAAGHRRQQRRRSTRSSCSPRTPTPPPAACAPTSPDLLGVDVAVVVSDTFGRHLARRPHRRRGRRRPGSAGAGRPPRRASTRTATGWRPPRWRWSTSSPRPPTWSRASSPASRSPSSAGSPWSAPIPTPAPGRWCGWAPATCSPTAAATSSPPGAPAAALVPRARRGGGGRRGRPHRQRGPARVPGRAARLRRGGRRRRRPPARAGDHDRDAQPRRGARRRAGAAARRGLAHPLGAGRHARAAPHSSGGCGWAPTPA